MIILWLTLTNFSIGKTEPEGTNLETKVENEFLNIFIWIFSQYKRRKFGF